MKKTLLKIIPIATLFIAISLTASAQSGNIWFFEGNGATQGVLGSVSDAPATYNLKRDSYKPIPNDEARSLILNHVRAGAIIRLYDSPDMSTGDDYTVITVKKFTPYLMLENFELPYDDEYINVNPLNNRDKDLDGHLSVIVIQ